MELRAVSAEEHPRLHKEDAGGGREGIAERKRDRTDKGPRGGPARRNRHHQQRLTSFDMTNSSMLSRVESYDLTILFSGHNSIHD